MSRFIKAKRFRHSPIFPLRSNFQFEYYSTCCSDIRCDQFLLRKREEGRKGERRVVHCTAARYLKVERGCYDERESWRERMGIFVFSVSFFLFFLFAPLALIIVIFLLFWFKMETVYYTRFASR